LMRGASRLPTVSCVRKKSLYSGDSSDMGCTQIRSGSTSSTSSMNGRNWRPTRATRSMFSRDFVWRLLHDNKKLYAEAPTHLQQWHSPLPCWLRSSMATCVDTLALARLRPSCRAVPDLDRIAVAIPELSGKIAGAIDTDLSAQGMRDMTKGLVTRRRGTIP
jgi:hypothetical protein